MSNQESSWGSDAKMWNPRRWLTSNGSFDRAAGPNIPFGLGQRSCFGQKLAVGARALFALLKGETDMMMTDSSAEDICGHFITRVFL